MCTHSLIRVHACVYTQYTHVFKSYICTIHTYTMYTIHTDTHVYAYAYMHVHNNLRIIFVHIIFIQRISHQDNLGSTYLYIHIQHISVYSYIHDTHTYYVTILLLFGGAHIFSAHSSTYSYIHDTYTYYVTKHTQAPPQICRFEGIRCI